MIKRSNGDLIFPMKGEPPECPGGYCRDKGNPFIFHLDLDECVHRDIRTRVKPCGKIGINMFCNHFRKDVNNAICNDCEIPEET